MLNGDAGADAVTPEHARLEAEISEGMSAVSSCAAEPAAVQSQQKAGCGMKCHVLKRT